MQFRSAKSLLGEAIATFFFVGRSPKAPGTCGSLAALPFAWYLWQLPLIAAWSIFAVIFLLGVWGAGIVGARSGISDDQSIVIDEVLGIFLTTAVALPIWHHYALSFILFRIFDIWKPGPVRWVDRKWKTPLGTIMDDIVAALLAAAVVWGIRLSGY